MENDINKIKASRLGYDVFEPLPESEKDKEFIATESRTYLGDAWNRFRKNKLALISLIFIAAVTLAAILVPIFSPYTYDGQDLQARNLGPCLKHLLGTDKFGRDLLVRLMFGARISLTIGFASALINLVIGVVYGGISGYLGGKVDMVLMRIVDILYAVPTLLYVILIMLVFGSNMFSILLALSISGWIGMARQVRAQILTLKEQEFSQAAFVLGASSARVLFKHLIINCMGPIIVNTTLMVPSAIFTEAFLSFVGIGISVPMASWGTMANDARKVFQQQPLQMLWPVLAISITILALHFVGDALSDALDPRKR